MPGAAGIVLAGGRSSRMGSPKAVLGWHGSTLLRRVTGIVGRSVDGPVVVVRAPGQALPLLDRRVEVVADPREGRGPMQGLAAGLAAIGGRASIAYVAATDVPLLHPAFVRRVVGALSDEVDVALPDVGGHRQPLAAAYRVDLLPLVEDLIAAERMKPAFLFERCRVLPLPAEELLRDTTLATVDPELCSVRNLNEPGEYARAHALPAPAVEVELPPTSRAGTGPSLRSVRAWSLGDAAAELGLSLDEELVARLNGETVVPDPELPLAAGDTVAFSGVGTQGSASALK